MKVYPVFFHRAKHATKEKRSDGLMHILAPSMLAICICAICLCGASWAWFTASTSTGTAKIQAAAYTVSVSEQQEKAEITETAGVFTVKFPSSGEYTIILKPTGNATTGYCKVNFESKDYYTVQLPSGTLSFTVYASENATLTVTPEWGTCAIEGQKIGNGEGDIKEIGTQTALPDASDDTSESTDTEPQPTTPADTTPAEETASAPDAPTALPESSADEE